MLKNTSADGGRKCLFCIPKAWFILSFLIIKIVCCMHHFSRWIIDSNFSSFHLTSLTIWNLSHTHTHTWVASVHSTRVWLWKHSPKHVRYSPRWNWNKLLVGIDIALCASQSSLHVLAGNWTETSKADIMIWGHMLIRNDSGALRTTRGTECV